MIHLSANYIHLPFMSTAKNKQTKQPLAWPSLAGTWLCITVFAWTTGGFNTFSQLAVHFLTGNLEATKAQASTNAAAIVTATAAVLVPAMIILCIVLSMLSEDDEDEEPLKRPEHQFALNMAVLTGEELVTRLLFLGLLPKVPGLDGKTAFFSLLLLGNVIWSALHLLTNRKWLLVLPQFVGGPILSMIYVSHGFFATLMTHIMYDMVMYSAYGSIRLNIPYWLKVRCSYHLLWLAGGVICFKTMTPHSLLSVWQFFLTESIKVNGLPRWNTTDYVLAALLLLATVMLLLEILGYDLERERVRNTRRNWLLFIVFLSLSYPIILVLKTFLLGDFYIKATVTVILLVSMEKTRSLSGVARLFWKSLLYAQLFSIMLILNGRGIISFLVLFLIYQTGERILRYGYAFYPIRYAGILFRAAISLHYILVKQERGLIQLSPAKQFAVFVYLRMLYGLSIEMKNNNPSSEAVNLYLEGARSIKKLVKLFTAQEK